jgi:hypothetical protein
MRPSQLQPGINESESGDAKSDLSLIKSDCDTASDTASESTKARAETPERRPPPGSRLQLAASSNPSFTWRRGAPAVRVGASASGKHTCHLCVGAVRVGASASVPRRGAMERPSL